MSDITIFTAAAAFLPPCRGKVRIGVEIESEQRNINVSTLSLALPLQGGGDVWFGGLFQFNLYQSMVRLPT
jgi:hypothetical protein